MSVWSDDPPPHHLASLADRALGNAKLFGAAEDMKLSSQQWNTGLSVFFVTYSVFGVSVCPLVHSHPLD